MNFTNPRLRAEIADYPIGGNKRGTCVFAFEFEEGKRKGWRCGRTTTGKTKYHTYGGLGCVVDGDDGKTYILQLSPPEYGLNITISRYDFKNAPGESYIPFAHARFSELLFLISTANGDGQEKGKTIRFYGLRESLLKWRDEVAKVVGKTGTEPAPFDSARDSISYEIELTTAERAEIQKQLWHCESGTGKLATDVPCRWNHCISFLEGN